MKTNVNKDTGSNQPLLHGSHYENKCSSSLKQLGLELPYPTPAHTPKKNSIFFFWDACTSMFTASPARKQNQPSCPPSSEWTRNVKYTHKIEFYSVTKQNEKKKKPQMNWWDYTKVQWARLPVAGYHTVKARIVLLTKYPASNCGESQPLSCSFNLSG